MQLLRMSYLYSNNVNWPKESMIMIDEWVFQNICIELLLQSIFASQGVSVQKNPWLW